jgi:hypothetical protein
MQVKVCALVGMGSAQGQGCCAELLQHRCLLSPAMRCLAGSHRSMHQLRRRAVRVGHGYGAGLGWQQGIGWHLLGNPRKGSGWIRLLHPLCFGALQKMHWLKHGLCLQP